MKFFPLLWAGAWRRRGRTFLMIASTANAILLFALLFGLKSGLDESVSQVHADLLITANKVSYYEPLPISKLAKITGLSGVRAAMPAVIFHGTYRSPNNVVRAFGIRPSMANLVDPLLHLPSELVSQLQHDRMGVLVPYAMKNDNGWKIGQRIVLNSLLWQNRDGTFQWPLNVVGFYRADPSDTYLGTSALVNYEYIDEGRRVSNGTSSVFLVRIEASQHAAEIARSIDFLSKNSPYETRTASERQLAQEQFRRIGDLGLISSIIVSASLFALLLSLGSVIALSVSERRREIGILKTVGFGRGGILLLILSEVSVISLIGAGIGLALSVLVFLLARMLLGFQIKVEMIVILGLLIAVGLAGLSSLPSALRAMQLRVVDALR
jgi:putative ABC transport system permease protein